MIEIESNDLSETVMLVKAIRLLSTALAVAVMIPFTPPPAAAERVALVIGNGAYQSVAALPNPTNDARDVAASLQRLGFSISKVENVGYDAMRRALLDFSRRARGADMAVVFFAGHGMEIGGENWLIPTDAELKTDTDAEHEAISLKSVLGTVEGAAKLGLVVLDACRNNPFAAKMRTTTRTRSVARGLARIEPAGNVLVAYAAKDGTTAADGSDRNSPFTAALLRHMETPGLEIQFLFRNVRDDVIEATKREQQPFIYGSLSKETIFLKEGGDARPSAQPRPLPAVPPVAVRPPEPPPVRPPRPQTAGENCASLSGAAGLDRYCASSVLAPQLGNNYGVRNLFAGSGDTAWVEGRPGQGAGEWVVIEFDGLRSVQEIVIKNGYQKNADIFSKNSRVRQLRVIFSQGQSRVFTLQDRQGEQTLTLDTPIKAYWMQFVIVDVYPGNKYTDTAISKLHVVSQRSP